MVAIILIWRVILKKYEKLRLKPFEIVTRFSLQRKDHEIV